MAYCTVKCMSSGVPFPENHCNTFLKFTEEKMTLTGLGGDEETEEKDGEVEIEKSSIYKGLMFVIRLTISF